MMITINHDPPAILRYFNSHFASCHLQLKWPPFFKRACAQDTETKVEMAINHYQGLVSIFGSIKAVYSARVVIHSHEERRVDTLI